MKKKCSCYLYKNQVCDICQERRYGKQKSLTMIIRDKLKETMEWFVPLDHIPSDKKLYYEAVRIRKAVEKYYKENRPIWKGTERKQPSVQGEPTIIGLGYQPKKGKLNSKKPPQGGSGINK